MTCALLEDAMRRPPPRSLWCSRPRAGLEAAVGAGGTGGEAGASPAPSTGGTTSPDLDARAVDARDRAAPPVRGDASLDSSSSGTEGGVTPDATPLLDGGPGDGAGTVDATLDTSVPPDGGRSNDASLDAPSSDATPGDGATGSGAVSTPSRFVQ